MKTKVISAFPACGKSTYFKNYSYYSNEKYKDKILDSDSSLFSWLYDENGNKTDVRNLDFPNNYIQHIKEHLNKENIIFVSSHKSVRDALKANKIKYYLIYPEKSMKEEWMKRFRDRGNSEEFIKFQEDHWDEFIDDMANEIFPMKVELKPCVNLNAITSFLIKNIKDRVIKDKN